MRRAVVAFLFAVLFFLLGMLVDFEINRRWIESHFQTPTVEPAQIQIYQET